MAVTVNFFVVILRDLTSVHSRMVCESRSGISRFTCFYCSVFPTYLEVSTEEAVHFSTLGVEAFLGRTKTSGADIAVEGMEV